MRRIWILDLALFALLVALATRFHNEWIIYSATHQAGAVEPEREKFAKLPLGIPPNAPAPANWTDIPSHNPFSFDRTDIAILEPKAPPPPPTPKAQPGPKPILYGTMSIGKEVVALVGSPKAASQKPMKEGEVIDGWTIVSIADKSMLIRGNDTEQTVIMNDPTVQITRDHSRTLDVPAAPNVVAVTPQTPVTPAPPAQTQPAAPAPPSQPQQPGQRRRIQQITPFGIREIEEP
jgi:hypothetical protein